MLKAATFISLGIVIVSILLAWWLQSVGEQALSENASWTALLGVLSLLGTIWTQVMADSATKRHQNEEFRFSLGVASHMATAVFDKQAEFCDKYAELLHQQLNELFAEATSSRAYIQKADELRQLRTKYAPFLPEALRQAAQDVEDLLQTAAEKSAMIELGRASPSTQTNITAGFYDMIPHLRSLLGINDHRGLHGHSALTRFHRNAREVLMIEELHKLRIHAVSKAAITEKDSANSKT